MYSRNIIQDDKYYYFFRALEEVDIKNIDTGTLHTYCEDYNSKNVDPSRYTDNTEISLLEIWDHIREHFYKGTNCISFSTNTNVSKVYGEGTHKYVMLRVSKDNPKNIYFAGDYMLTEMDNYCNKIIETLDPNSDVYQLIEIVDGLDSIPKLKAILDTMPDKAYSSRLVKHQYFNDEEELEYSKKIVKLSLLETNDLIGSIIPRTTSNKSLISTIGMAFSSSEIVHYGPIYDNLYNIPEYYVDILSLLQQAISLGLDNDKVNELERIVIDSVMACNEYSINREKLHDNVTITEIYNLTNGTIPYYKAYKAYDYINTVLESKIYNIALCDLLKNIVSTPKYDELIEEIKTKTLSIPSNYITRKNAKGYQLCESVNIDINEGKSPIFTHEEQEKINNYIANVDLNNIKHEPGILTELMLHDDNSITENQYYAQCITDFIDYGKVYSGCIVEREITQEEKNIITRNLEKANCVRLYNCFMELVHDNRKASGIIINLLMNDGYGENSFVELSNSSDLFNIIKSNIANFESDISGIRLDYLIGIRDNSFKVEGSNITLRDYQKTTIDRLNEIYKEKNYAGVVLPTGAGKSFVAITEMLKHKNDNILYYAPNIEILNQIKRHIIKYVLNLSIIPEKLEQYYLSNLELKLPNMVFEYEIDELIKEVFPYLKLYCYQGLGTKEEEFFASRNASLIIFDEAHRTGGTKWNQNVKRLIDNNKEAKILGITATPIRDVDQVDMIRELAKLSGDYTRPEINTKRYMAAEMYLVDAIQENIVVAPNIITFDYSLKDTAQFQEVKRLYESATDPSNKEKYKEIYDEMRNIIKNAENKGITSIIKNGFDSNNKPYNGRYIIFLPVKGANDELPSEEHVLREIEKAKKYFEDIDSNPEVEYLISNRKDQNENKKALSRFQNDSDHLKLMFAVNMLNEGVHIDNVDGIVMLRPLGPGNKILYYQQIGRCIYSIDPDSILEKKDLPIIFDIYNNYLEQDMNRQINRHSITSDLQKVLMIKEWIDTHHRYPDINSFDINEARKASTLKRIKSKYLRYIMDASLLNSLNETDYYEVSAIIEACDYINLWDYEIPERIIPPKETEIAISQAFSIKGEQKTFVELFKNARKLEKNYSERDSILQLRDALNTIETLTEYGITIDANLFRDCKTLGDILSKFEKETKYAILDSTDVELDYPIIEEYKKLIIKYQNNTKIYDDYNFKQIKSFGFLDTELINELGIELKTPFVSKKGFVVAGPHKFRNLNVETETPYGPDGYNINGLDELGFRGHEELSAYFFDREGYYYELQEDGTRVKTSSRLNPCGFDYQGYYNEIVDGKLVRKGKLDPYGFNIDGLCNHRVLDAHGFDCYGYPCVTFNSSTNIEDIMFDDGENIEEYILIDAKFKTKSHYRLSTPYNLHFFDRDGYYYELQEDGTRVKTDRKYNDRFLDIDGYYYELQADGTRLKTNKQYDDDYFGLDGNYYALDSKGRRVKTKRKTDENGRGVPRPTVIYAYDSPDAKRRKKFYKFDIDGYCYTYDEKTRGFVKIIPETIYTPEGFDKAGYYHPFDDGGKRIVVSDLLYDEHGFDITHHTRYNEFLNGGFDYQGYYYIRDEYGIFKNTGRKYNDLYFDIDGKGYWEIDGKIKQLQYNRNFFSIDGFYWEKIEKDGKKYRKKTNKKLNRRNFDISGYYHPSGIIEDNTRDLFEFDEHGFDINGYFWEPIGIDIGDQTYITTKHRTKTNKKLDARGFNVQGYYCKNENGTIINTKQKYDEAGFDIDGYYKELDEKGNKRIYNDRMFNYAGYFVRLDSFSKKPIVTSERLDKYDFDYLGRYKELDGVYVDEFGFNANRMYVNEDGTLSKLSPNGFDGYFNYYPLDINNVRSTVSNGKYDEHGFNISGINNETHSKYDKFAFDVNGINAHTGLSYDNKHFTIDGYYCQVDDDGSYTVTDRLYNDEFFDRDGYYWKVVGGVPTKTKNKMNPQGYDINGYFVKVKVIKELLEKLGYNVDDKLLKNLLNAKYFDKSACVTLARKYIENSDYYSNDIDKYYNMAISIPSIGDNKELAFVIGIIMDINHYKNNSKEVELLSSKFDVNGLLDSIAKHNK